MGTPEPVNRLNRRHGELTERVSDPRGVRSSRRTVYERRQYAITTAAQARQATREYWTALDLDTLAPGFGLPEVDDRYHVWRVPVVRGVRRLGEVVVDARTGVVERERSTDARVFRARWNGNGDEEPRRRRSDFVIARSELRNTVLLGDSERTLAELPAESVDLVFTSPPYFNARPDYTEHEAYAEYLAKMGRIIGQCHRLLTEGRFFVLNVAPVLLRRSDRSRSSRRLAVPFDLHSVITRQDFDFVDDIIWEKPEGAGWATGRGRRFAADRHPLQYKAVPVTEYVLVYRKRTDRLIDWNIRCHPDPEAVRQSRIGDDYERTNIWKIPPTSSREHPAVFPRALADRVVKYYSFKGDVVLDPFAGIGTVGESCAVHDRRFVLAEVSPEYMEVIKRRIPIWLGNAADAVHCVHTPPIRSCRLF